MSVLVLAALSASLQQPQSVFTLAPSERSAISPYVYGANFPDWPKLKAPFPLARQGGNRMSAYNWETNASNAGSDWQHQNDGYLGESNEPGWTARTFFQASQTNGAAVLLTVPTLGYVSADKNADGDVNKTPNYLETRFHRSLPRKPGRFSFPPNTSDRVVYQDEFVAWVERTKSPKTPIWYSLDNEPDLWPHTHERIMPKNPGYAGILKNNIDFGSAIKAAAPKSLIFGPANYGWQGFRRFQDADDAGDRDFLDFYLAGMKAAERKEGRRILDVLDIHFYPEARGGGVRVTEGSAGSPATQEARVQAPRSLWDPAYVEDSWITENLGGKAISLLPGIRRQIARHYPGTRLAVTEYSYGGGRDWSGLLAQADVLGIYGREGVFAAANWGIGPEDTAMIAGFRAFLNYDGRGSKFGSTGLGVRGGRAEAESLYASAHGRRLTLVAVNKTASPRTFLVRGGSWRKNPAGFLARPGDPFRPGSLAVRAVEGGLRFTVPARSVATVRADR
ncbi:MAG: glycoside hydrolase family 44 protein [Fimbriimonadaceae bacterium]|nr:glycoside hydrolase family 44 protein [Fimbriimonadaceae bacterium]